MSDGSLSQDEIDALLQGSGGMDFGGGGEQPSGGGGAVTSETWRAFVVSSPRPWRRSSQTSQCFSARM